MFIEIGKDIFIDIDKVTDFRLFKNKGEYKWSFFLGEEEIGISRTFKARKEAYNWLYQHFSNKIKQSGNEIYNVYRVFKDAYDKLIKLTSVGDKDFNATPYWIIIDPEKLYLGEEIKADEIARCITGIFFNRDNALEYMIANKSKFSKKSVVYSLNGVRDWEQIWKTIEDIQREKETYKNK